jgi:hypothetical protein
MPRPYTSSVIDASADDVWALFRDFGGLAEWHPALDTCEIEPGPESPLPGAVRRLTNPAGTFRERLLSLDDATRTQKYEFLESPFPVRRYISTIRVFPVTDTGRAFVEWWAEFDADGDAEEGLTSVFADAVFGAGLRAAAERLGK